jgi:soluble lytic murein transglycosylase-like protein
MVRFLLAAALAVALPASARSPLHMWTDSDGVLHVDDVPPSRAARTLRKAPAPQATTKAQRSDAPPDEIDRAAQLYNVPAELVRAVIWAESAGDAAAVSRAGALGLMQLMPRTAGDMYVQDPVDPAQNIMGGTRYLRWLANQFGGDMLLTLAAYNAGPEAVRKYNGVPPFDETRQYCKKVMAHYRQLKAQSAKGKLASNVEPAK